MIVNDVAVFANTITRNVAFEFDSLPVLRVTKPDGTVDTSGQVSDATIGTATSHSLQGLYTPNVIGRWSTQWAAIINGITYYDSTVPFFVTYTRINDSIRELLKLKVTSISEDRLDIEYRKLLIWLEGKCSPWTYASLTGANQEICDLGSALIIASRLRGQFPKRSSVGELIAYKQGQTEFRYADLTRSLSKDAQPLETQWEDQGWDLLACITGLQAFINLYTNRHVSHADGERTRLIIHDEYGKCNSDGFYIR